MPLYEYACTECKEIWEETRKVKDCLIPTNKKCPKCDAKRGSVYRHLSVPPACGIEFGHHGSKKHNTSGWQETVEKMASAPGVKGTPTEKKLRDKHLN